MTATERTSWLAERNRIPGVGSSDSPNLVGLGYKTAAQVYDDKVFPVTDFPRGRLLRGLELEEVVAAKYAQAMGFETPFLGKPDITRQKDRPWQFASIDRMRDDGRPVELKTTAGWPDGWGPPGAEEIPDGYAVQVQHQLSVLGADWCDVAALDVIDWEFRVYRIARNEAYIDWLVEIERRFVDDHLIPKVPPGPEWEAQFADAPVPVDRGLCLTLGADVADLCRRRAEFAEIRKAAEKEEDRLTGALKEAMGAACQATAPGWKLTRTQVEKKFVDGYLRKEYVKFDCRRAK